jgi:nucleoid DNA-binding protein
MIKIDIVKRVADALSLKDREALAVVDTIVESIKDTIKENDRIEIRNFGVFQVKQRKPRTGRNPRNKREYPIKPRKVVTFKLGKELKDAAVQGSAPPKAGQPGEGTAPLGNSIGQQPSFLPPGGDDGRE